LEFRQDADQEIGATKRAYGFLQEAELKTENSELRIIPPFVG
jgi:hypothetical protein